jgi:hypothetical protein
LIIVIIILENEPFSTNVKSKMSGIKRTLSIEDSSLITNDNTEQSVSPNDSPNSKKLRHESSHSGTEEDTQIIEEENGIINGKINKNYSK